MDHLQNVMGYFDQQQPLCAEHDRISKDLYKEFGVKAGLRDENGKGVLAGLTNISDIRAFQYVDGVKKPADGHSFGRFKVLLRILHMCISLGKSRCYNHSARQPNNLTSR